MNIERTILSCLLLCSTAIATAQSIIVGNTGSHNDRFYTGTENAVKIKINQGKVEIASNYGGTRTYDPTTDAVVITADLTEVEMVEVKHPLGEADTYNVGTYVANKALDFSSATDGMTAYIATETTLNSVALAAQEQIAANEAFVMRAESPGWYCIPVYTGSVSYDGENNMFLGSATEESPVSNGDIYALSPNGVFAKVKAGTQVAAGKAYLKLPESSAKYMMLDFDGDNQTAIDNIESVNDGDAACYNLAGQRVSRTHKGFIIVNGKKIYSK